jgi:hypothetical protein
MSEDTSLETLTNVIRRSVTRVLQFLSFPKYRLHSEINCSAFLVSRHLILVAHGVEVTPFTAVDRVGDLRQVTSAFESH